MSYYPNGPDGDMRLMAYLMVTAPVILVLVVWVLVAACK